MVEQELASIAKYMNGITGINNIYFDEVPEGFKRPSLYFPVLEQITRGDTLTSFAYMNTWFIKVFDKETKPAFTTASNIVDTICKNKNLIPLVNEDGSPTGKGIRLKEIKLNKLDIGTIQIQVDWDSVYEFKEESYLKMQSFYFDIQIKGGQQ